MLNHHFYPNAQKQDVGTFQSLAFSAGLTILIPKAQYTRASSMMTFARYASGIGAPLLGGFMVSFAGINVVLLIDIITFLFGVGVLFWVHIPQPHPVEHAIGKPFWLQDVQLNVPTIFAIGDNFA